MKSDSEDPNKNAQEDNNQDLLSANPSPEGGREKWKRAIKKIRQTIHSNEASPIDTVRLALSSDDRYLQELGQDKQIFNQKSYPISKLTQNQLREHELNYKDCKLYTNNGFTADTINMQSKHLLGVQAFVMSKDGSLYIGTHPGTYNAHGTTLTHGSFLNDAPAEMSGLVKIINGKIIWISNNSGHYQPEGIDMYRGISKLEKDMRGIFDRNCIIELSTVSRQLTDFMTHMESILPSGKALHEHLRDERQKDLKDYKYNLLEKNENFKKLLDPVKTENLEALKNALSSNVIGIEFISQLINIAKNNEIKKFLKNLQKNILTYTLNSSNFSVSYKLINEAPEEFRSILINISLDDDGNTILHLAMSSGSIDEIKSLIEKTTNINIKNCFNDTALHIAASQSMTEVVRFLLEKGADPNIADNAGHTPLYTALTEKELEITLLLIDNGANINEQNKYGETALIQATYSGNVEAVKDLLKKGANINIVDRTGATALVYSINYPEIKEMLTEAQNKDRALKKARKAVAPIVSLDCCWPWSSSAKISSTEEFSSKTDVKVKKSRIFSRFWK